MKQCRFSRDLSSNTITSRGENKFPTYPVVTHICEEEATLLLGTARSALEGSRLGMHF